MDGMTAVSPTPATTSPESTSAPVSTGAPATSSPAATGERPRTLQEAFARDAAQQTSEPSTPPEAATTAPVEGTDPQSATPPSTQPGPIPFAAHKTALDNARLKATQEAQATFDRDFGWAKAVPRETLQEWSGIASLMASDPPAFLDRYFADAASHPQFGAQVRSWAARTLATRAHSGPAESMPGPDVQIVDAAGQVTGQTYSAEQLAKRDAWRDQQLLSKVQQEFGPLKTERDQEKAQAQAAETHRRIEAAADDVMADVFDVLDISDDTTKAQKDDLLLKVHELMAQQPTLTVHKAALQVRKAHIVPAQDGKAQAKLLESLKTKAAAQSVNPAGAVVTATTRPKSFLDKSLQW
jgi:hypothetical protein